MYILSQLAGLCAVCSLLYSYQQKKRKNLLILKLAADISWVGHYLLLGAYAGIVPNFVGIFREMVFINSEKHKWANTPLWPAVFLCLNLTLGILSFDVPIDALPIIASVFVTISLWLKNPNFTKLLIIPACTLFLIYNLYIGSLVGAANETMSIVSIIIYFIRRKFKNV